MAFEDKVKEAIDSMTKADDGTWVLPDGLDEETAYAVNAERRRRDTQASYSRAQASNKALQAENIKLAEGWQKDFVHNAADNAELDELKATDPDAWRARINAMEQERAKAFGDKKAELSLAAKNETEIARRTRLFEEFNAANPSMQITDDVLANDVPPKFLKQLEAGDSTFEEFLANVQGFLTKGKVIASGETPPQEPNMSKAGGSSTPSSEAVKSEAIATYRDEIY